MNDYFFYTQSESEYREGMLHKYKNGSTNT